MTNPEASEAAEIDGLEARLFDALSFFWRGVRTEAWFAAWPEIVSGVSALEGESESENDDGDADDAIAALAPLAVERAFACATPSTPLSAGRGPGTRTPRCRAGL